MHKKKKAELIPFDAIRIINPRRRTKKKLQELIASIEKVGLKKPITLCRRASDNDDKKYDLVCGQGRLEAARALGWTKIPAIVIEVPEEDRYLMSLAENLARTKRSGVDRLKQIGAMAERGQNARDIATNAGLDIAYVRDILRLLKAGEERLLRAVEQGKMPLTIATKISKSDDKQTQKALREAYESGQLTGSALVHAKRLVEQRSNYGLSIRSGVPHRTRSKEKSAEELVRVYRKEAERQKMMLKKNQICETRLRFTISALQQLFSDENFTNLLRAETLDTLPKNLADKIQGKGA